MQHIGFKHTALLYSNNLNQNALKKGRSDCFFVIEGLYRALLQVGDVDLADYFRSEFDENEPYNATERLLDMSVKTRGEHTCYILSDDVSVYYTGGVATGTP